VASHLYCLPTALLHFAVLGVALDLRTRVGKGHSKLTEQSADPCRLCYCGSQHGSGWPAAWLKCLAEARGAVAARLVSKRSLLVPVIGSKNSHRHSNDRLHAIENMI